MKTSTTSSPKATTTTDTPAERRNGRLKELATGKLLSLSLALAKTWTDDRDEVLQGLLFTCLESHEADVAAGKPEQACFLFQKEAYIATRCSWVYRNWRRREMRQEQSGDTAANSRFATATPVCGGTRRLNNLDKVAGRIDVRGVLAKLSPVQAKWCKLLMQGYPKGEAGRRAGGWTPYQTTMARYAIRAAFTAAGVTP